MNDTKNSDKTTFKFFDIEFSGPSWMALIFIFFCLLVLFKFVPNKQAPRPDKYDNFYSSIQNSSVKIIHTEDRTEDAKHIKYKIIEMGGTVEIELTNRSSLNKEYNGTLIYYNRSQKQVATEIKRLISTIEKVKIKEYSRDSSQLNLWLASN